MLSPHNLGVEQLHLRIPSSNQAGQYVAACMNVLLHVRGRTGKVVLVHVVCDLPQVAATKVEGETDEGVELILIELPMCHVSKVSYVTG